MVSYIYHYNQLASKGVNSPAVKLSLLIDYFTAGSALIVGTGYLLAEFSAFAGSIPDPSSLVSSLSLMPIALKGAAGCSVAAVTSLGLCWVWEYGRPYLFWHSAWHLFSAATCYFVGVGRL